MPPERIRGQPGVRRTDRASAIHHPPRGGPKNPHTLVVPAASSFVTLCTRPEGLQSHDRGSTKRHHTRIYGHEATAAFITLKCGRRALRQGLDLSTKSPAAAIGSPAIVTKSNERRASEGVALAVPTTERGDLWPATYSALDLSTSIAADEDMAPVRETKQVSNSIKDVIQHLFDLQSQVHGYQSETTEVLVDNIVGLAHSLSHLQTLANNAHTVELQDAYVAPELIDYVDDSRNPDIYTRELVEAVQRGNAVLNSKMEAFRRFSEILAALLKKKMPEASEHVDRVMSVDHAARSECQKQEHAMENGGD